MHAGKYGKLVSVLGIAVSFLAGAAQAAEFYPRQVSMRTFGTDQGNVGDCQSAAETGALEAAFANKGYGFVKLSLFYRHAANWVGATPEARARVHLSLGPADLELIQRLGPIVPDYMWPEAAEGYSPRRTKIRPAPAEVVVQDASFVSAAAHGFKKSFFSFKPGFSNSVNIEGIKQRVAAGEAVVLNLHGALLFDLDKGFRWDHVTGLITSPYSWNTVLEVDKARPEGSYKGISHAVAVVGYDDSIYADRGFAVPGAFIIRNSWNDGEQVKSAFRNAPTKEQKESMRRMRLKLFSKNLPGYYAVPYQYVHDVMQNNVDGAGIEAFELNYAAFATQYLNLSSRYQIVHAPFVCDEALTGRYRTGDIARREVKSFGAAYQTMMNPAKSDAERGKASHATYQMALREMNSRSAPGSAEPVFRYALLSRNKANGQDRVADFYAGKFNSYYCPHAFDPAGKPHDIWPTAAHFANERYQRALEGLADTEANLSGWYSFLRVLSEI